MEPGELVRLLQRNFGGVLEVSAVVVTRTGDLDDDAVHPQEVFRPSSAPEPKRLTSNRPIIVFDRVISDSLEAALSDSGVFRPIVERTLPTASGLDAQLRRPSVGESVLTIYAGLTAILEVRERRGTFRFGVHETHAAAAGFDEAWRAERSQAQIASIVPDVLAYLDRIMAPGAVDTRYSTREGRVQTMIATSRDQFFAAFQREAVPSFVSQPMKDAVRGPIMNRILRAMRSAPAPEPWWPGVRDRGKEPIVGSELDVLALDLHGRLLAIEVKPADAVDGIAWAPGQTRCYAELFARWLEVDPAARDSIIAMSAQRRRSDLPRRPNTGLYQPSRRCGSFRWWRSARAL